MTRVSHPTHHLSIETLTGYAAGSLRAGFDVVAAAHIAACPVCRTELPLLESVGGLVLEQSGAAELAPEALARTMSLLDTPEKPAVPTGSLQKLFSSAKRRWVAPGVWVAKIETPHAPEDRVYMLSAAPGAATAMHTHSGLEFTQILSGALMDGDVIYRAGDFTERDSQHTHWPRAHGNEPCVCLFATQGRLVPSSWIGRLAFALANV
jgi:putative transcriptional regulator